MQESANTPARRRGGNREGATIGAPREVSADAHLFRIDGSDRYLLSGESYRQMGAASPEQGSHQLASKALEGLDA